MNGGLTAKARVDVAGIAEAGVNRDIGAAGPGQAFHADAAVITVRGRAAWALVQLVNSGNNGCSYIDTPAPRWGGYVHKLRRLGIAIETVRECHGGPFRGRHARYVLRSIVTIVEMSDELVGAVA